MSLENLQQAIGSTRGVLAGVGTDELHSQTPCASWDVAALINHMVGSQHFFSAGVEGTAPTGQDVDYAAGDFVAAYDEAAAKLVAAFSTDGVMAKTLALPFGEMPGAAFAGLAATDVFTHGWDLARATGQSTDLAPDLASTLLEQSQTSIQEAFRGDEGVAPFGAERPAAPDACSADRLAAFLGRSV